VKPADSRMQIQGKIQGIFLLEKDILYTRWFECRFLLR
jgi:hypothetical protein